MTERRGRSDGPDGASGHPCAGALLGAVLAGGRSRRFGRDKTAEPVAGVPMIERAVATLGEVCEEVVVVSSRSDTPSGSWTVLPDMRPGLGPLAGVESALAEARRRGYAGVVVLAADLPLVDAALVRRVVDGLGDAHASAASRSGEPDFEPLCAVYRVGCLDDVRRLLDGGSAAARALFESVGGVRVVAGEGAEVNVNTAADLARAEERLVAPAIGPADVEARSGGTAPPPGSGRLISLDAFRGVTIAAMILVNNPGSWSHVYPPLAHAAWHGWTPTDLIFPYFLFIVGVAVPFSFHRRLAEGSERVDLLRHIARRSAMLVALGLAMRAVPDFDLATMRYYGVLQRIGLVYFAAASAYVFLGRRDRLATTATLLLGYWALMTWVPVPGYGRGDLSPEGNLAAWIDRLLLDGHLWQGTWDPEGLLSTLPAIATTLLGIFTGEWLRSAAPPDRKARALFAAGAVSTVVGLAWDRAFPINKNLWTSSYVVFTVGTALVLLGVMYWLIDVRRQRGAWQEWMVVYGRNAIAVFVASGMVTKAMTRIRVAEGTSLYTWVYEAGFRSWAGDRPGSLAFAATYVLVWLGIMWILHARRIYVKI